MVGLLLALLGGLGVFYLYTALVLKWDGIQPGPTPTGSTVESRRSNVDDWFAQAGLEGVSLTQFAVAVITLGLLGAGFGFAVFGSPLNALILGVAAANMPLAGFRVQRQRRRAKAHESWPRMIEEIRILTSSAGRSVPQALFDVGRRAPKRCAVPSMQPIENGCSPPTSNKPFRC